MASILKSGVVHTLPGDMRAALRSDAVVTARWNDLTPLAQNEWICWVVSVKKPVTRTAHLVRLVRELVAGKRRPCCWPGCPHRATGD